LWYIEEFEKTFEIIKYPFERVTIQYYIKIRIFIIHTSVNIEIEICNGLWKLSYLYAFA
jgi:hypothetical protein